MNDINKLYEIDQLLKEMEEGGDLYKKRKKKKKGNVDALIRHAGDVGFKQTVKDLKGKRGIKDPERLVGWLKARARERGQLAERFKMESEGDILKSLAPVTKGLLGRLKRKAIRAKRRYHKRRKRRLKMGLREQNIRDIIRRRPPTI